MNRIILSLVMTLVLGLANGSTNTYNSSMQNSKEVTADADTAKEDSIEEDESFDSVHASTPTIIHDSDNKTFVERILSEEAFVILLVFFVIFGLPFLIVVLIITLIYKNRKHKYEVMQAAIEKGVPLSEPLKRKMTDSDEYIRRKGIKNTFLGLGLAAMFGYWNFDLGCGIGILMLCYGIGQVVIAYTSHRNGLHKRNTDEEDFMSDIKDEGTASETKEDSPISDTDK